MSQCTLETKTKSLSQADDELEDTIGRKKLKTENESNQDRDVEDEANLTLDDGDESLNENLAANCCNYGIRQLINPDAKRFHGQVKQSPSDFIVNEIDLEGNVVELTDLDIPVVEEEKPAPASENLEQEKLKIKQLVGEEKFLELTKFLDSNLRKESFKIEAPKEKSDRKLLHDFIKLNFTNFNTNTVQNENKQQMIEICHNSFKRNSMKDCYKNNTRREIENAKYCECALYKENIDTMQAVNLIAKHLRINIKRISYAGTKDKCAKTTQRISLFKMDPKQIVRLNKNFYNIKLGNFRLTNNDSGVKLGDLFGNRFKLVIREVDEQNDSIIKQLIESLRENGFINYYGLQRFGNFSKVPTHSIGRLLILNKIKEAVDLILQPRDDSVMEKEELKRARKIWINEHDANKAYLHVEKINCVEKFLLKGLSQSGKNDFLGAFQNIPRNTRLMYLHAYQSYIWNEATSERVKLFGLKPCIGDLAMKKLNEKETVVYVNENNLNEFSIEDVVLPLPGHDILYPKNSIGSYYDELLSRDDLKKESFKNKIKDFSLCGDYRKIMVKAKHFKYDIVNYTNKKQQIAKSDWDIMCGKNEDKKPNENETTECQTECMKAIYLEFSLPSSSYATMALRELIKD